MCSLLAGSCNIAHSQIEISRRRNLATDHLARCSTHYLTLAVRTDSVLYHAYEYQLSTASVQAFEDAPHLDGKLCVVQAPDVRDQATSNLAAELHKAYSVVYNAVATKASKMQHALHTPAQMKTILGIT